MSIESQHLLVLLIVLACGGLVVWQIVQTFIGRKSKIGSCCAKGCESPPVNSPTTVNQFLPLESLTRRK